MSEEERKQLAKRLGVPVEEIGGGKEYGQFWHGPDEYPINKERGQDACARARIVELSYSPSDALDMEISGGEKTLRGELVARAAEAADIPDEARDIWAGEVGFVDGSYVVTLYYDKDSVQKKEEGG